ncbi:unnamed protein product [Allacma fusca]|uniref:Major facilitator superfamily (MFS) profile domain-containing protein n=1 Tax=Allacma fusca TaxID=39272 RepID=A0A8J2P404_9HEXA|nr:unnamed protein product [Allacma fusca]
MERVYNFLTHRISPKILRTGYEPLEEDNVNSSIMSMAASVNQEFVAKKTPQYLVSFIVSIGAFSHGTSIGWSAPALPNMEKQGDFPGFKSDSNMATWLGAITFMGCFFSGFFIGFLLQHIGRKWTMLVHGPPFLIGWLVIAFAPNLMWILVGRFITGLCGAGMTLGILIYIGEVAQAKIRGTLCNAIGLAIGLGILFTYILGSIISWSHLSLVNAFFPGIFTVGVFFIPESPYYLLANGRIEETLESLKSLRGATEEEQIIPEYFSKKISVQHRKEATWSDTLAAYVLKPFGICMMLIIFQQFGGIKGVLFYSVEMFSYAGTDVNANIAAITLAGAQVIVLLASTQTVEIWGRRISIMVSELGMTISLVALGTFFYLKEHNEDIRLEWLPLTSLLFYVLSYNLGVGPVTWTLVSELLPSNSKGLTSSIIAAFSHGLAFLITKFFIDMQKLFTSYGCYWFFAAMSFAGFVFCLVVIPETKGKKLQDIQAFFRK